MRQVLKWVILLCVVSFAVNGLMYWRTGNSDLLINLYSSAVLGVLSAVWLIARKK